MNIAHAFTAILPIRSATLLHQRPSTLSVHDLLEETKFADGEGGGVEAEEARDVGTRPVEGSFVVGAVGHFHRGRVGL